MDGIELAIRFSYITNILRFCGPEKAKEEFLRYIEKKDNQEQVTETLKKFESLYPYLSIIAKKSGKKLFDKEVTEAYWIGNELLESFTDDDMKLVIMELVNRGLPKSWADSLVQKLPNRFVPHHNFNVFYVGVGMTTQSVETNLLNMDNCRTGWGRVLEVMKDRLVVASRRLKQKGSRIFLAKEENMTITYLPALLAGVKKGDMVALHWGFAPMILDERQLSNLEKYTQRILDVVNSD